MNLESNVNAFYCDPNAYIHKPQKEKVQPKKVVFSEPYECMPSYYIDNNFKKGHCDCVGKEKPCDCERLKQNNQPNRGGFNFQSLLPLLSILTKGGGADFSQIASILGKSGGENNPMSMISSLLSSSGGLGNIMNIFKPKQTGVKKDIKTTDFEIKNYTRVE